jgi:V-type H+-transporting ATPase subunit C
MSAAVGQQFWIVAAGCTHGTEKDSYLANLKSKSVLGTPWKFDVPDGDRSLMFGSFDNLIRLTDELAKYDAQVDSVVHRLERQYLELDPKAVFKVKSQRQDKEFMDYLEKWQWDEAKYPKTRAISDNLTMLMTVVNKLDEEARNKTAQYNDFKSQKSSLAKKDVGNLMNRDLVDVLTPDTVSMTGTANDDFIYTDRLSTVAVVIPRGSAKDFCTVYENMCENVVPRSAKHFNGMDDKDGNSVWRVVMFKSAVENFKRQCRERRFVPRDFEYSEEGFKKLQAQREQLDKQVDHQLKTVMGLYQAAWSDTMVAYIHIKAMRVFVESVLRFGMPPSFASFIIRPKASQAGPARKALAGILGKGQGPVDKSGDKQQDDDEEYFPYVSTSFTPFTIARG